MTPTRYGMKAEMEALSQGEFIARVSTASLDRDGEVLLPLGMDPSEFARNPIVCWNHDYTMPPIGVCVGKPAQSPDGIIARTKLASRPEGHVGEWFPDTVGALIQQGVIRGVSVGFIPLETRAPTSKDRETWGDGVWRIISKWRLLEYSVVPLPANQDALITAVGKGILTADRARQMFGIDIGRPAGAKRLVVVRFIAQGGRAVPDRQHDMQGRSAARPDARGVQHTGVSR